MIKQILKNKDAKRMAHLRWDKTPENVRKAIAAKNSRIFWDSRTPAQRKAIGKRLTKARKIAALKRKKLSTV